MASSRC